MSSVWRRQGSIRSRFLVAALCVEAFMLTLLVVNSVRLLYDSLANQARANAEQVAPVLNAALVAPLAQRDYATLQAILNESHAVQGFDYLAVMDNRGKVVASSGWPADKDLPPPDQDFTLAAKDGGARYDVRRPVVLAGQALGTLQFGLGLNHIVESRKALLAQGVGIAIGEMALSTGLLIALGLWLTRHFSALTRAAEAVAKGDFGAVSVPQGDDEAGRLGSAFNAMSRAVDDRLGQLQQALRQNAATAATLDRERARLLSLLSAMEIGVLFVEPDGRIAYANPALGELLRLPPDVVGRPLDAVLGDCDTPIGTERIQTLFRSGEAGELQLPDGRTITYRSFPVLDLQGTGGWLWTLLDVSASRLAARQLIAARDAAESANQAKAAFLATMSHEIRTPMNGVIGMTGLLLDTTLNTEQRHFAETIRDSAEALLTVINDILDFSKMEAGKLDLDRTDFDPAALVESVVDILAPRARAKGIDIVGVVAREVPACLRGDPGRLRQILMNLAGNAIKFTPSGGVSVRVSAAGRSDGRTVTRFEVNDSGIGIPVEAHQRLFAMFTQVDASTARRYGGTGLGLAISKRIAETMGGRIGFESEPGKGSRFWVEIPLEEGEAPLEAPAATQEVAPRSDRRLRILVAEDNPVNQQVALGLLRKLGHSVDMVGDGAEAVAAVRQLPYDLVLMDVQMPEMDGLKATQAIRDLDSPAARTPIVAMTANAMRGDDRMCLDAGMDGYISKPIDRRKLEMVVASHAASTPTWTAPTPAGGDMVAIDMTVLDTLAEDLETEMVVSILGSFHQDAVKRAEIARAALASGDLERVRAEGHAVKGAAASLGLFAVRDAALGLENAAKTSDGVEMALAGLEALVARLPRHLRGTRYEI